MLGGATFFEVTTQGAATHFRFDGQPLTADDCRQSLSQIFENVGSRRSGCLGLSLSAAHSVANRDLTLKLADGCFTFDGRELSGPERQSEASGVTEIRVPGNFGFTGGLFRREASLEETLLLASCAPLWLTLDGRPIGSGWKPEGYWKAAAMLWWQNEAFPLRWAAATLRPCLAQLSPGPFSAMLILLPPEEAARNGLTIVHHGISYRTPDPEFHLPGLCAIVMTDALERNLSRSEIVRNESYVAIREAVKSGFETLVQFTLSSPYRFVSNVRQCEPSITWAFEQSRQRGKDPTLAASWLATEARLRTHPSPQDIVELAEQQANIGNSRKSEDFLLAAIELLLDKFRKTRSRELAKNLATWAPLLEQQIGRLADSERKVALLDFLTLALPFRSDPNRSPSHHLLTFRLRGRPQEAAALLEHWSQPYTFSDLVPVEVLLAVGQNGQALSRLLGSLGHPGVDQALKANWATSRLRNLDLLADILEYLNDPRALAARQLAVDSAESSEMRYLTSLEMCRHARARGRMGAWVRARVSASYFSLARSMSMVKTLSDAHPLISGIIEGTAALPQDVDAFLLPVWDLLGSREEIFPFLSARLAHRLRLASQPVEADRLLARCYMLRVMDRMVSAV